ncbi:hypothetical protein [Streptomyces sp. NPDC058664]|uniref:hypothetical protein n=1 Tax=unclassified Streptomyces TaxID=2593676 RepID=UPI0036463797
MRKLDRAASPATPFPTVKLTPAIRETGETGEIRRIGETGPAPDLQRRARELPRAGHRQAPSTHHRFHAPRRTY